MKTLVTTTLLTMLLTGGAALAADRADPAGVPPKGIEGPDVRYSQLEARHSPAWPYVR
jgi:hypothetical protein